MLKAPTFTTERFIPLTVSQLPQIFTSYFLV
uniref:Uncharacterized protein n=1 Tax=Anguilla anguilla TaxID=7936 RepID=A0A0E9WBV6_ANGAN